MNSRLARLPFLAVLLLALFLRVVAAVYWHQIAQQESRLFRLGDSHSYWILASEIARGLPYQYGSPDASIFRAPVYPLVLSPCTWVGDERTAVWLARLLGCGLGTVAVALTMVLSKRFATDLLGEVAGNRSMLLTGVLAAIYPGAIGMSIVILSEAIFCPLMLVYLWFWQTAWQRGSKRGTFGFGIAAGCVAGLAILARPSWMLFAPMLFAVGMILGTNRVRHATIFCATLIGMGLTMSPWWIRNASITGEFVLTTLQVGPSLYDGLHAGATGGSDEGMAFMAAFAEQQRTEDAKTNSPRSTFEFRLNQRAQRESVAWVKSHPMEVALLAWRKFLRTWSLWPNGGEVGSGTLRAALTVGCFTIVVLAIIGSIQGSEVVALANGKSELVLWAVSFYWLPVVYFTLLHMIFVGSIRYREPAVLVLTIVAGLGLTKLMRILAGRPQVSAEP